MYLVTGATGQLGRRVVRRLIALNQPVRAFVRLRSNYELLKQWGADIFIGDIEEVRDIEKACAGVNYVISCHASKIGSSRIQKIDYRGTVDLIDQAKKNGIHHFSLVSPLAVVGDRQDSPLLKAKYEVESYLEGSGLPYTIFRPTTLMSSLLPLAERFQQTGIYFLIGNPEHRLQLTSPDDLARVIVAASQMDIAHGQTFSLAHPTTLTRQDIPKQLGYFFNRQPFVVNIPMAAIDGARHFIGLISSDLQTEMGTLRTLLAYESLCPAADIEQVERLFNIQLESWEMFLNRYLGIGD